MADNTSVPVFGSGDHKIITEIKSQVDIQGAQIGMLTESMADLTKNVNTLVQTVERNTSSNQHLGEKVDRIEQRYEELEPRVRTAEQAQAVNKTKWAITAAISASILAGLISLFVFIIRPVVAVDSASDENAVMIERLTTIIERIEDRANE